ncbi:MAG TPA: SH3 domain-containing protein [Candidatus Saccharimonadales bacterium]|nr:SH3 domain-containing protein [Candidatus Saccharimonadales bacterium]
MQSAIPHRLFDRVTLSLMVVIVALPLTYLEVAHPTHQQLSAETSTLINKLPHTAAAPVATSKPAASSSTSTAQPTVAAAIQAATPKTATTNSYVHLRAGESVNSAIITDIVSGTTVQLRDDANPTWQGVTYQGKSGYIYRAYLQY